MTFFRFLTMTLNHGEWSFLGVQASIGLEGASSFDSLIELNMGHLFLCRLVLADFVFCAYIHPVTVDQMESVIP